MPKYSTVIAVTTGADVRESFEFMFKRLPDKKTKGQFLREVIEFYRQHKFDKREKTA